MLLDYNWVTTCLFELRGKHNDLDDVGKDTYHHTFKMLSNSSSSRWKPWVSTGSTLFEYVCLGWETISELIGGREVNYDAPDVLGIWSVVSMLFNVWRTEAASRAEYRLLDGSGRDCVSHPGKEEQLRHHHVHTPLWHCPQGSGVQPYLRAALLWVIEYRVIYPHPYCCHHWWREARCHGTWVRGMHTTMSSVVLNMNSLKLNGLFLFTPINEIHGAWICGSVSCIHLQWDSYYTCTLYAQ